MKEVEIVGILGTWRERGPKGGRILAEGKNNTYWVLNATLLSDPHRFLGKEVNAEREQIKGTQVKVKKISMKEAAQCLLEH
jgi:hypothetical protein